MDAIQVILPLFLIRLVLPIGSLLLIGEWLRNHQHATFGRR